MSPPKLTIHGAGLTVTGSCFEYAFGGHRLLIDCGLFQGSRTLEALNREPLGFDPRKLDGVIVTHAHIDHSGLLPRLVAEGYRGPIWCTKATLNLLEVMLPDAARIQEQDVERRNRRADRAGDRAFEPTYTVEDAARVIELARTVKLGEAIAPCPGVNARFWNAGHILGSASVEIAAGGVRTIFSGDLGPAHKSFHPDPAAPSGFDHVVCESTYGDRDRDEVTIEQRRAILESEVKAALGRGGNLVIPVFALERTQELLLDLARLINTGCLQGISVFVDSPLASKTTKVFWHHRKELEDLGSGEVFRHPSFHYVENVLESMRLNTVSGAVILSASGMCEAGRIRHHLLHNLPRRDSTVLFVGFQAQGTLGRAIVDGAQRVRISGRDVAVRAQIRRIDSYSAHADRGELLQWIKARAPISGSVFLTHGEAGAIEAFRRDLQKDFASVIAPEIGETYELSIGAPARRLKTGRIELRGVINRDWQNAYADFAANLKRELERIESPGKRAEAVTRMRAVIDELAAGR
ncbi:MAG: MBL fold metallo-hydrolase [Novosphingobium sp.]